MKKLVGVIYFLVALSMLSCAEQDDLQENEFLISGKVNYLRDGYIKLKIRDGENLLTLDSSKVEDDSTFILKGTLSEPQYAQILFFDKQAEVFPLTYDRLEIEADGNRNGGYFKVKGSPEAELHNRLVENKNSSQIEILELKQRLTYASAREESSDVLRKELEDKIEAQNNWVKHLVDSVGTENIVGMFALVNMLDPIEQFDYYDQKAKEIGEKENPSAFEIRFISEFNNRRSEIIKAVEQRKVQERNAQSLADGNRLQNIALPTPTGNILNLEDFRGQYVLVDFWAGWCGPCRRENPNLVNAYTKYKSKGFEIFGVSLDKDKGTWLKAIEQDQMNWVHVSDLKYWESEVVSKFNITGIPANFLLDPEGRIIGKNLRGQALQDKLAEIFKG